MDNQIEPGCIVKHSNRFWRVLSSQAIGFELGGCYMDDLDYAQPHEYHYPVSLGDIKLAQRATCPGKLLAKKMSRFS